MGGACQTRQTPGSATGNQRALPSATFIAISAVTSVPFRCVPVRSH